MPNPKITIAKKFVLDKLGHYRFCNPMYPKVKGQMLTLNLEPNGDISLKTHRPYPYLEVSSEKQLLRFLLNNWGPGEYRIVAHLKGREGCFTFWRGEISSEGWIFYQKKYNRSEADSWRRMLTGTETDEEKQMIKEEVESAEKYAKEEVKAQRYGFSPFLQSSGKRGEFHNWNDAEYSHLSTNTSSIKKIKKDPHRELSDNEINAELEMLEV